MESQTAQMLAANTMKCGIILQINELRHDYSALDIKLLKDSSFALGLGIFTVILTFGHSLYN